MKRYYLAYGSNLNVEQMLRRCPGAVLVGTAELPGWQLLFKGSKTGSYLTIEKAQGESVPVGVWEITPAHEASLDRYEGFPTFYYKKPLVVNVKTARRTFKSPAFAYVMHEDRPLGAPSQLYVDICAQGYRDFGFDPEILEAAIRRSINGN